MRRSISESASGSLPELLVPRIQLWIVAVVFFVNGHTDSGWAGELHLKWNDNSNIENGYIIERQTDPELGFIEIGRTDENATTFTDSDLVPSHDHTYRVAAFNRYGVSGYSNTDTAFAPSISFSGDHIITIAEDEKPLVGWIDLEDPDTEAKDLVISRSSSDESIVVSAAISIGAGRLPHRVAIPLVENANGPVVVTLQVSDGVLIDWIDLLLTVVPVNDPSEIEPLDDMEIDEDSSLNVPLVIQGPDGDLEDLKLTVSVDDPSLLQAKAHFERDLQSWILEIRSKPNRNGESKVEVEVEDGDFLASTSFVFATKAVPDAPEFLTIPSSQAVIQGADGLEIMIDVRDVDSDFNDLVLEPTVSKKGLLLGYSIDRDHEIGMIGANLVLNPNWSGLTTVTLELRDETGASSEVFIDLEVEPGPRVFFGTLGENGRFALYVSGDGSAAFLGWDPESEDVIFRTDVGIGVDGVFSDEISESREPALSGKISGFKLTGRLGRTGPSFAGEMIAIDGSMPGFIGLHVGFIEFLAGGVVRSIGGPDGKAFVVLESDSIAGGTMIDVDYDGLAQGNWLGLIDIELQLNSMTRRITGQAEYAGLHWPIAANQDPSARDSQLANLSTRAWAGTGSESIIAGFVVEGSDPIELLIRGIGPGLSAFGVLGVLEDPHLVLKQERDQVATNQDWGVDSDAELLAEITQLLGGFSLALGSLDSAMVAVLGNETFTAIVRGEDGTNGIALVELYNATLGGDTKLINLSTRLVVREGGDAILGFVVIGSTRVQVLIRAVGPGLEGFGVAGVLPDPHLRIYGGSDTSVPLLENDNWATSNESLIQSSSMAIGAFPLDPGSRDAAVLVWLDPGIYSAKVSDANGDRGVVLTELYVVP